MITDNDTQKKIVEETHYTDLSYLNNRTKADPKLMAQMISFYLAQTPPLALAMKQSFEDGDREQLDSVIHKMIPSFSIVGINSEFVDMAKKIQLYAHTNQQTEDTNNMVMQLANVCNQACVELEDELKKIKGDETKE